MDFALERIDRPAPRAAEQIRALIERARVADGVAPVSEQGRLLLRDHREGPVHLVATAAGPDGEPVIAGYAQLTPPEDPSAEGAAPAAELTVDPVHRRAGLGTALLDAVRAAAGPSGFLVWAHGGLPAARALAAKAGLVPVRELRQMRRPLTPEDGGPSPVPLPEGVTVRTFEPGRDEEAWLALNAAAFAHHPEQGSWTREDLDARLAEPWFDPKGFFLAERLAPEGGGPRAVGFHWTKTHPEENLGEVYVVGVAPGEQGSGLGKALTDIGVRHLADRGLPGVLLYVDEENRAAVRVYERLGFSVHEVDLMYRGA
ncbi:mycothiol synthase [Mangrovactinospora gilvigrisea]|uniref:Mycothiol acetyltransferase n=1 Tax=Mangrovactinospora gilvigrisea TaxID=1428644 RepID=A0A1J7BTW7_9ACTN|nr:mycothiol synthase [Mangrovactinospora gilvigrisea]OIV36889.1 mycothiol synthase [Mangrovactinospora gilvigrisea]